MSNAGNALLGIGMGTGERRAIDAAEAAVASPLLETSMDGARSILLSITGGPDLSLWEVNEAARAVADAAHPDANIIFGTGPSVTARASAIAPNAASSVSRPASHASLGASASPRPSSTSQNSSPGDRAARAAGRRRRGP